MVWKKASVIIAMLVIGLATVHFFGKVKEAPDQSFQPQNIPNEFEGWVSKDIPVDEIERKFLPEDTQFVKRMFTKPNLGTVYLVAVFTGKDRRSIHQPEVCYPSQGWTINSKQTEVIPVGHPIGQLKTTRLDISFSKRTNMHEIVLYWFMGNERVTATHWKRVLLMGFDRCVYGRNHKWAFLRTSTPVKDGNTQKALEVIRTFVQDMFPNIANDQFDQF